MVFVLGMSTDKHYSRAGQERQTNQERNNELQYLDTPCSGAVPIICHVEPRARNKKVWATDNGCKRDRPREIDLAFRCKAKRKDKATPEFKGRKTTEPASGLP